MVKLQGFLIVVYPFAFLRTKFLLTVCRPVNTATHLALTLTIIVIAFFCNSVSFYFVLSCLVAALLCAENLSVAYAAVHGIVRQGFQHGQGVAAVDAVSLHSRTHPLEAW